MRAVLAACLASIACGNSSTPPPAGSRVGPALAAALTTANDVRAPWRCASLDGPKLAPETLALGKRTWRLDGDTASLAGAARGPVTIGVIADAGGAAPATVAALGRLRARLVDADIVVVLGGMGATRAELEATLGALAEGATQPVIAVPGDLEAVPDHTAAIAALRARHQRVIDGRLARRIELPGVAIVTVPGARTSARLVAGVEGCAYAPADVTRLLDTLSPRPGIRILATAEAPRHVVDGDPVGELAVTPSATRTVDLVLHAPADEPVSLARQGDRDGARVVLTPGTADATTRLPGPRRPPSAGLLVVSAGGWRWRPVIDDTRDTTGR